MNLETALIRTGRDARMAIRGGDYRGDTSSMAPGYVQANLAIIPSAWAYDFLKFCQRNPKPCPLLGVGETGQVAIPGLAEDLDIRCDVSGYRVWRDGRFSGDVPDLTELWQQDWVTFAIGCSFSFEQALQANGITVRNVEQDVNVSMFVTNIQTERSGPFGGPLVVTMRPMKAKDAIRAVQITARYPKVHGAPIHFGDPRQIGIRDLSRPDYGDAVQLHEGEVPVFWACGVTPQTAIQQAGLPICVTHENPLFGVDSVPFLATSYQDSRRLYAASKPSLEKLLASQGMKLLFSVPWPGQSLYSVKPINGPDDLRGSKMRAYNPATSRIAQLLKAQPTTIQLAELGQALATGTVENFLTSSASGIEYKLHEQIKYLYPVNAWLPRNATVVNLKAFESLDKATQDAVLKAAATAEQRGWQLSEQKDAEYLKELAAKGMKISPPPDTVKRELRAVGDTMTAEWLKTAGPEGKQIVDAYMKP